MVLIDDLINEKFLVDVFVILNESFLGVVLGVILGVIIGLLKYGL